MVGLICNHTEGEVVRAYGPDSVHNDPFYSDPTLHTWFLAGDGDLLAKFTSNGWMVVRNA